MGALVSCFQFRSLDGKKCTVLFVRKKKHFSFFEKGKETTTNSLASTYACAQSYFPGNDSERQLFHSLFFIAFALNFFLFLFVSCKRISTQSFLKKSLFTVLFKKAYLTAGCWWLWFKNDVSPMKFANNSSLVNWQTVMSAPVSMRAVLNVVFSTTASYII